MSISMKSKVIKIGNSRGIRIPGVVLEQVGMVDEVELIVEGNQLIIQPVQKARADWDARFSEMHANGDDTLMDENISTEWDDSEWTW